MSSVETLWYMGFDSRGRAPKSDRLIRLPHRRQIGMAIELALDLPRGLAGYRNVGRIEATGETYWYWPSKRHKYDGWWLLPERTIKLMQRATKYAEQRAHAPRIVDPWWASHGADLRETYELSYQDRVRVELRRLLRSARRARDRLPKDHEPPEFMPYVKRKRWITLLGRPPRDGDDPWRSYYSRLKQPKARPQDDDQPRLINPDSKMLLAARHARAVLLEARYDLAFPPRPNRRYENPHPEGGDLIVEVGDGREVPIVEAARIWGAQ